MPESAAGLRVAQELVFANPDGPASLFGDNLRSTVRASRYRRCAGAVVVNAAGLVFAGIRQDAAPEDRDAFWQMPQGGCDADETPEQTARRELYEETSIASVTLLSAHPQWLFYDIPLALGQQLWRGQYYGQQQRWYCFRFTGSDQEINLATAEPEFRAWQWLSASDVVARAIPFKQRIYKEILTYFAPYMLSKRDSELR